MARPTQPIELTPELKEILETLAHSREAPHSLVQRSVLVLQAAQGATSKAIGASLGLDQDSVCLWRKRWLDGMSELNKLSGQKKKLHAAISDRLSDKPRSGSPCKFSPEQVCQIIAMACETPPEPLSHWSCSDLAREAVKRGIADSISKTTIGRFLKSGRSKTASHPLLVEPCGRR